MISQQHVSQPEPEGEGSFSTGQLLTAALEMGLYKGPPLTELPEQVVSRMVPLLKKALEVSANSTADWQIRCTESTQTPLSKGKMYETIEYQFDHFDPPGSSIDPEAYEYEGSGQKFRIDVVDRKTGAESGMATRIFSAIREELREQFRGAPAEAISSMMSYDIIAATRTL